MVSAACMQLGLRESPSCIDNCSSMAVIPRGYAAPAFVVHCPRWNRILSGSDSLNTTHNYRSFDTCYNTSGNWLRNVPRFYGRNVLPLNTPPQVLFNKPGRHQYERGPRWRQHPRVCDGRFCLYVTAQWSGSIHTFTIIYESSTFVSLCIPHLVYFTRTQV